MFLLVGTKCVYWVWKGQKNAVFLTLTQFRVLNKNYECSEEMVADMYSRICTKISFLHVLSTLRALLSTLWASVLWELSKKHQKIDENWWKFVKNLLSWNMFLIMLDAFWIQKNMFKVQKISLKASEHIFSVHGGVFWVKSPQKAKISSTIFFKAKFYQILRKLYF